MGRALLGLPSVQGGTVGRIYCRLPKNHCRIFEDSELLLRNHNTSEGEERRLGGPPGDLVLKIAWNAVISRLGGLTGPDVDADPESEEDRVDVDKNAEKEAEIERRKRILKGQLAREAARQRDKQPTVNDTSIPASKDTGRTSLGKTGERRLSVGAPVAGPGSRRRFPSILSLIHI